MSQNRGNNKRSGGNGSHSRGGYRGGQSGVGNNHERNRNSGYVEVTRDVRDLCESPVFKSKVKVDAIMKPGYGSNGTPIKLIANLYPINTADITYYHYDVEIKLAQPNGNGTVDIPQPRVRKMRKLAQKDNMALITQLTKEWTEMFGNVSFVFDGLKNLYTNRKLSFADKTQVSRKITIKFEGVREESYEICVQYTKEQIELSAINDFYDGRHETVPKSAIQALEIMLRYMPTQTRIPVGNKLFSREDQKQIFPNINMALGHYQAVDLTEMGAAIVIDAECTYFYKPEPLITFVLELMPDVVIDYNRLKNIPFTIERSSEISDQISGLKIYTDHTAIKRYYTIYKLTLKTPVETVFTMRNNDDNSEEETNVEKYFLESHEKKLEFTNVPCISVKENKFEKLPVEVCHVRADQPVPKSRITPDMTAAMIDESNQKPLQRFSFIQESAEMVAKESDRVFSEFGVRMKTAPFLLMGRVLDAPKCYGSTYKVKFGRQLSDWVFINLSPDVKHELSLEDQLAFVNDLSYTARGMGIRMTPIGKERLKNVDYVNEETIDDIYQRCTKRFPSLQMIIFCIPDKQIRKDIYRVIKYCGDIKYGIISQCIKDANVLKKPKGYDSKFLYKLNGRLGGVNTALAHKPKILQPKSTIVIGADVSHPSETDEERFLYSIASVVGSYDEDFTKYWSANRVQVKTREEIITDFGDMVHEILVNYKRNNDTLPQKILYYRDGVSDGQFEKVDAEYQQLIKTCHKLDPNYAPNVTFIIVQKRHVKRFMPYDHFKEKPIINIPAGTVVDRTITHPLQYEFYLNSHHGLMGTNRPTKYVVLRDDNNMTVDEVQQLTYHLCYTYFKSDRSISIPTPVKYAHLAADRSKQHIVAQNVQTEQRVNDETKEQRLARESKNALMLTELIRVSDAMNASMYYC